MPDHPTNPRNLVRTKWTSAAGAFEHRHWEVVGVVGDEAELRPALGSANIRIPWRALRDRTVWQPGWISTD